MKNFISLLLLLSAQSLIVASGCCAQTELSEQESAFIEKKQTELVADERELNAVVDVGIDAIVKEVAQDAHVIRYTVTLSKDRTKDSQLWLDILKATILTASRANASADVPVALIQELCNLLFNATTRGYEQGIVGDVTISMGNGEPTKTCCGDNCQCAARYNGNCPCSLERGPESGNCRAPIEETVTDEQQVTDPISEDEEEVSFCPLAQEQEQE